MTVNVGSFQTVLASETSLTFTSENWNTPQSVTVSAYEDDNSIDAWGIIRHHNPAVDNYWWDLRVLIRDQDAPLQVSGTIATQYAENATDSVATYTVEDDGDATVTWTLLGEDKGDFTLSDSGELSFKSSPDYENPADSNEDNVYELFIDAATDSSTGFLPVTVTVTDVEETPIGGL